MLFTPLLVFTASGLHSFLSLLFCIILIEHRRSCSSLCFEVVGLDTAIRTGWYEYKFLFQEDWLISSSILYMDGPVIFSWLNEAIKIFAIPEQYYENNNVEEHDVLLTDTATHVPLRSQFAPLTSRFNGVQVQF